MCKFAKFLMVISICSLFLVFNGCGGGGGSSSSVDCCGGGGGPVLLVIQVVVLILAQPILPRALLL